MVCGGNRLLSITLFSWINNRNSELNWFAVVDFVSHHVHLYSSLREMVQTHNTKRNKANDLIHINNFTQKIMETLQWLYFVKTYVSGGQDNNIPHHMKCGSMIYLCERTTRATANSQLTKLMLGRFLNHTQSQGVVCISRMGSTEDHVANVFVSVQFVCHG